MRIEANTPDDYFQKVPDKQKEAMLKLRKILLKSLPKGFEEVLSYGMPSYAVPHSIYPQGYHCKTSEPLPFISLAAQKQHIGFYHMGIYSNPELMDWFISEFPKHSSLKLDMGKSCIRFKNPDKIPFELLEELVTKVSCNEWIDTYEASIKK